MVEISLVCLKSAKFLEIGIKILVVDIAFEFLKIGKK